MTDKFKKIEREYVLSDSSVNEYGFRLLTSVYDLDAFKKNPIGYYMHRREDGIVLKWDDLRVEDDRVLGTPVINLVNGRGEQTLDEAENGFLNAASVGHIVVLEHSTDPALMLPGQTGPTVTRWYNKECSLVDIPGNCNALTKLYDAQENEINLADFGQLTVGGNGNARAECEGAGSEGKGYNLTLMEVRDSLRLTVDSDDKTLLNAVKELMAKTELLDVENKTLLNEKQSLQQQLDELVSARNKSEITALLNRALEDKKVTVELRDKLAVDYSGNPEGLKALIAAMPAYQSIAAMLKSKRDDNTEAQWQWDDFEKNDPTGSKLKELRANDPVRYKELFGKKFAA